MPSEEERERRLAPRVTVGGRVLSTLWPAVEATLLNLSSTGACLEHQPLTFLRPGSLCELLIRAEPQELRLRARAVWSMVSRQVKQPEGTTELLYRTGLEFLDLTMEQQEQLAALLRASQGGGGSVPPVGKVFLSFLRQRVL